ncbi:F-box domain-containing protein [Mycena sanguinolenta]|uniref:F-box domain-containing protein n=1 Tax=Mycena sanguinolenta TaxID=230812 RepID=A0A8H6XYP3_9AGAR|nr:F-box domain-containing protein [Mycena sanguinolenta]
MTGTTILSLPNELLVAIALAGQEERFAETFSSGSHWQTQSTETSKSEWTLSRVSQRFRSVIVDTPSLWTLAEGDLDDERSVQVFRLYLQRSQTCKISITLRQSRESKLAYDLLLKRVDSIAAHFSHLQRLRIAVWEWRTGLESTFRDAAAPQLEYLEVVNIARKSGEMGVLFSSGAPKLDVLRVENLKLDASAAPWAASLMHLELLRYPIDTHTRALPPITRQCPGLVRLHLDTYLYTDVARVHIATLEFLHVSIMAGATHYLLNVVDLFDTPALTELWIEGSHGDQIGALFNSTPPLHVSFPVLTSLSFVYRDVCGCDASGGLSYSPITQSPSQLFPMLASLTLVNECFTPDLIRHLLGSGAQPWPFLNRVAIYLVDYSEEEEPQSLQDVRRAFEDAENARRERGDPLPRVALGLSRLLFRDWDADWSDSVVLEMIW